MNYLTIAFPLAITIIVGSLISIVKLEIDKRKQNKILMDPERLYKEITKDGNTFIDDGKELKVQLIEKDGKKELSIVPVELKKIQGPKSKQKNFVVIPDKKTEKPTSKKKTRKKQ